MTSALRMSVTLGLLLLVGFLLTSTISFLISRNSIRETILNNELPLSSDNIYSEIQRDLFEPILISSLMANDTFVKKWIEDGESNPDDIVRYLGQIQARYKTITSFLVTEATRAYYQSHGVLKTVKKDDPADEWFFRVRDMAENYEINVDPDMANRDAMTIFINYRVLGQDGEFLGATGVGLTVDAVKMLMQSYKRRFNREVYFYDLDGELILHSLPPERVEAELNETKNKAEPALQKILDQIDRGENPKMFSAVGKNGAMANYRYIPELEWILVVEQTSDGTGPIFWQTFLFNLIICLLTAVVLLTIIRITILRYQVKLETHNQQLKDQNDQIENQAHQLLEANRKLDAMHREKDEFIGITVHDLKNPLSAVTGFAELLINDPAVTGEIREHVQAIHFSSIEMLEHVEGLLQLTELESAMTTLFEKVDLNALVQRAATDHQYHAEAKQISIVLDLPPRGVTVATDAKWLLSAIRNLVSNAIKYSPNGESILLSIAEMSEHVEIRVKDAGVGIPDDEQKRLFQKFVRLSSRPTAGESSNGLGLYIVSQIVARLRGQVSCQSRPGHGSIFTITLPKNLEFHESK